MSDTPNRSAPDPSTWVDEHGDVLYRFTLLRVKDPHVAEDLVQETFVSALQGLAKFRGASTVRTWLVGILKHKIIDYFRKSSKEIFSSDLARLTNESEEEAIDRLGGEMTPHGPLRAWRESPDNLLDNKEFMKTFRQCLAALPEAFRSAFSLRELDGLKTDEICKILSITPTNLWVILHRARNRLRTCLDTNWFAGDGPGAQGDRNKGSARKGSSKLS